MNRLRTDFIAVHCSATQPFSQIDAAFIDRLHKRRGWSRIGYHYVIKTDGTIERGREEKAEGAHVYGYNDVSIGICMVGGVDETGAPVNNYTPEQFASLQHLVNELLERYPAATVQGHRDFPGVSKACPCFDAKSWWSRANAHSYKRQETSQAA